VSRNNRNPTAIAYMKSSWSSSSHGAIAITEGKRSQTRIWVIWILHSGWPQQAHPFQGGRLCAQSYRLRRGKRGRRGKKKTVLSSSSWWLSGNDVSANDDKMGRMRVILACWKLHLDGREAKTPTTYRYKSNQGVGVNLGVATGLPDHQNHH